MTTQEALVTIREGLDAVVANGKVHRTINDAYEIVFRAASANEKKAQRT